MRPFIFPFLLFFISCSRPTPGQQFVQELDHWLQERYPADQPGMAIALTYHPGNLQFLKGYGLADLNTKKPITPETRFNLGSVSKTMVALAILKLEEAGKLSIEDPILQYFPEFEHPEIVKNVKLKHLLSHTSGIPDIRPVSKDSIFYLTANDYQNFAPLFKTDSLHFQPGEGFEYSNPAFNGLALVIEKVSGQKWQTFIKEQLFQPAGMLNSVFTDGAFPDTGVAHGYRFVGKHWEEYDYGEYPTFCASGNGGAWSSVQELLMYEKALETGKIVNQSTVKKARTIFTPENWKANELPFTGFDWFILEKKANPSFASIGHTGDQAGFRADYIYYPAVELMLITICNDNRELIEVRTQVETLADRYLLH